MLLKFFVCSWEMTGSSGPMRLALCVHPLRSHLSLGYSKSKVSSKWTDLCRGQFSVHAKQQTTTRTCVCPLGVLRSEAHHTEFKYWKTIISIKAHENIYTYCVDVWIAIREEFTFSCHVVFCRAFLREERYATRKRRHSILRFFNFISCCISFLFVNCAVCMPLRL